VSRQFDAIIIGTGQADPSLAARFAAASLNGHKCEEGTMGRNAARWVALLATAWLTASCRQAAPPPATLVQLEGRSLFTCCNLHYEKEDINDANYWVGKLLPAGTPVRIDKVTGDGVTFSAADVKLKLTHEYGTKEESLDQYLAKVLVANDPKPRIAAYPAAVRRAIAKAKVERGMTREQVLVSLGYPATHRTPSLQGKEWTYWYNPEAQPWYNRWVTYQVVFDDAGKVSDVVGRPAPTAMVPILNADAPPQSDTGKNQGSSKTSKKHKQK
jgi:outer membrane protein assembly factor BamE (lipoprotein component of BamABCDE complex)